MYHLVCHNNWDRNQVLVVQLWGLYRVVPLTLVSVLEWLP